MMRRVRFSVTTIDIIFAKMYDYPREIWQHIYPFSKDMLRAIGPRLLCFLN